MDRTTISNWVRQSRHRARRQRLYNHLNINDVVAVVEYYNNLCAYCNHEATTLDHPFPIKDKAPNVLANILPICSKCKAMKGSHNILAFHTDGAISETHMIGILRQMFSRSGGDMLREYVKRLTGHALDRETPT